MSKIFKAINVNVDVNSRVIIESISDNVRELAKNSEPPPPTVAENEEISRAEEEARKILAEAKKEAAAIVEAAKADANDALYNARAEAAAITEQAHKTSNDLYEQSKSEGYDIGYTDGMEATAASRGEAEDILREAHIKRESMLGNIEGEIVDIISAVSQKLIGAAADIDPRVILCLVKQGFDDATIIGNVKVHVSKDDYNDVLTRKNDILTMTKGVDVEIVKNMSLNRADCIIETPYGNIDCSLEQQFNELKKNLYIIFKE